MGASPPGSTNLWATTTATGWSTGATKADWLQHYGSQLGQSLYDYCYDLNGDKTIDLFDYVIWRQHVCWTV